MLLEFYRAYVLAKLAAQHQSDELNAQFVFHTSNCLNILFSRDFAVNEDSFDISSFCLHPFSATKVTKTCNKVLVCIFTMVE